MQIEEETLGNAYGLLGILYRGYLRNPNQTVIQVGENALTYKELIKQGESCAAALYNRGIRKNDRIGVMTANSTNWYVFLYATLRIGAIIVPFDPQIGQYEMTYLFDRVGIRMVLVAPSYRGLKHPEMLEEIKDKLLDLKKVIVDGEYIENDFFETLETLKKEESMDLPAFELSEDDTNIFICTTGSTGNPKIVDLPGKIFNYNNEKNAGTFGFEPGARLYLTMPLYHAAGFGWGICCLSQGGTIYYDEAFQPTKLIKRLQDEKITKMLITPTLMRILLSHPKWEQQHYDTLGQIILTGEKLDDTTMTKLLAEQNLRVINAMGMSEALTFLIWDSEKDRSIPNNQFSPVPGIVIKLVDNNGNECKDGEAGTIHIKNIYKDSIMKGYFRLPEVTKETLVGDGWLNTGDLGVRLENGKLAFMGRKKRVVKRGGNLISPEEIEDFLRTHPLIESIMIDHEEDPVIGEKLIAYIQTTQDATLTKDIILAYCKGNISAYKIPDEVYFVDEIPKTSGKTNLTKLKQLIQNGEVKILNK